ncbi:amino acid ABC transporter substrate-binding protein [Paenibacillus polymyxa]|uniref:amino acid ABC transporter substrate-binding protein n=1 Tax=Paenibacillus polymyxa TaxID=1406 RepID=UPI0027D89B1F|nr:amino acid ABC transporter substrate-binding protein [Paenibacillus polymyxa]
MKMKKFLGIMIAGMLLVVLAACGNGTSSNGEKVLRVGATGQSFPNSFKEGDKLVGYDVEVLEAVAKNLGYKVEWTLTDFSGLMGQMEAGKLDTIANNVAVTDERKKVYNFTDKYSVLGTQVAVRADNNQINTLDDLKGKTISAVLGSNNVKNFKAWDTKGEVTLKTYETRESAMNEVITGKVDGYINASTTLLAEIAKGKLPLKLVGDPISHDDVAFPFARTEQGDKLLKEFNAELQKLRDDGTLLKISEKYYGEDVTQ